MRIGVSNYHQNSTNFRFSHNNNLEKNIVNKKEDSKKQNNSNVSIALKGSISAGLTEKGKKSKILDNLMKQKQNLMDSKGSIMEKSLKNGENPQAIKEKIQEINKQVEEIDKQINKLQTEDKRDALGTKEENKKKSKSKSTTNNVSSKNAGGGEGQEEMDRLLNLSKNLSQTKDLSNQKNSVSGELRILNSEIKIDESRGVDTTNKRKHASKIEDAIENIDEKIGDSLSDIRQEIKGDSHKSNKDISATGSKYKEEKSNVKQLQVEQNIKIYIKNSSEKNKDDSEKLNITA